jgi:hypothetical protein
MRRGKIWPLIFVLSFLFPDPGLAGEDAAVFVSGVRFARAGRKDFAYMGFRTILRDHPHSRFFAPALFSTGEYSFALRDIAQARKSFQNHVIGYPGAEANIFALAYLWKIADMEKNESAAEQMIKEIVNLKQVSLIFRKSQEYKYRSPMDNQYLAVIHIDHIEIFLGGVLFAKIPY